MEGGRFLAGVAVFDLAALDDFFFRAVAFFPVFAVGVDSLDSADTRLECRGR